MTKHNPNSFLVTRIGSSRWLLLDKRAIKISHTYTTISTTPPRSVCSTYSCCEYATIHLGKNGCETAAILCSLKTPSHLPVKFHGLLIMIRHNLPRSASLAAVRVKNSRCHYGGRNMQDVNLMVVRGFPGLPAELSRILKSVPR